MTALALRSKRAWGYDDGFMASVLPDMVVHPEFLRDEYGLVAEEGSRIVGYAIVRIDNESAFLRDLFVDPDRFRRGIGMALFARVSDTLAIAVRRSYVWAATPTRWGSTSAWEWYRSARNRRSSGAVGCCRSWSLISRGEGCTAPRSG